MAFRIMKEEIKGIKFVPWYARHGRFANTLTFFAGADIEALKILSYFKASFSENANTKIFWCACLNILIKNIPQVTIQVSPFFN